MKSGKGVCTGKEMIAVCSNSRECDIGLSCYSKSCQKVTQINEICISNSKCTFGSLCNNGKCERFGSVEIGQKLNVITKVSTVPDSYLCKSFYMNSNNVCAWGPSPNFEDFDRAQTGDNCSYNVTDPVTKVTTTVSEPATCGFN